MQLPEVLAWTMNHKKWQELQEIDLEFGSPVHFQSELEFKL